MSEQPPPPKKKPRLSKFGSAHARKTAGTADGERDASKTHGYLATQYHQNANRKGIHALVKFDCPVCRCKNTVLIDLDNKSRLATVRCTYCLSLKPRPAELPYPFTTSFTPKLENKADAFFRFSEKYNALARQGTGRSSGVVPDGKRLEGATAGGSASPEIGKGDGGSGGSGGDGLLGGLDDILAAALHNSQDAESSTAPSPQPQHVTGHDHEDSASANQRKRARGDGDSTARSGTGSASDIHEDDRVADHDEGADETDDLVDDVNAFFNDD